MRAVLFALALLLAASLASAQSDMRSDTDLSLLYGRSLLAPRSVHFAAGVGLGLVEDSQFGGPTDLALAIPAEVSATLHGRYVGVRAVGYANLNGRRSFAGLGLGVTLGLHH